MPRAKYLPSTSQRTRRVFGQSQSSLQQIQTSKNTTQLQSLLLGSSIIKHINPMRRKGPTCVRTLRGGYIDNIEEFMGDVTLPNTQLVSLQIGSNDCCDELSDTTAIIDKYNNRIDVVEQNCPIANIQVVGAILPRLVGAILPRLGGAILGKSRVIPYVQTETHFVPPT
jgi:hypothetical protein